MTQAKKSNTWFLSLPIVYAIANIVLLKSIEHGMLPELSGHSIWPYLFTLIAISLAGTLASVPVALALRLNRVRVHPISGFVAAVIFGLLTWFNIEVLHSASAAV